ncbi:hypothetical protein ANCDUO_03652 [Ancylostoma duodenale]|uniref:Uncharacterized protein n=1 Tax=Ancylostoma duodenale TaxID=51022 RepID=A0A0C2H8Z9_9BILA|nr:hypothetical protein ANCDUO_03652 [Ancylostoma duodenale]
MHAHNCAENASTKYSPYFLIHGQEPTSIFQLALRLPTKRFADTDDYVNHLTNLLQLVYRNVRENLNAQEQQKHQYDLRRRNNNANYHIGEKAWIRREGNSKITPRFEGPFPILDIDRPNITVMDRRRERTIHIKRTKPFCGQEDTN